MIGWLKERRYLVALLAFNIPWIIGFTAIDNLGETDQDLTASDHKQIENNTARGDCTVKWSIGLIDALQDGDVKEDARTASEIAWLLELRAAIVNPPLEPETAQDDFVADIDQHVRNLRRVQAADIDHYPSPKSCLRKIKQKERAEQQGISLVELMSAPLERRVSCFGKHPTIRGSKGGDVIHGTDGRDVIASYGGTDLISAGGGKDRVCSGKGADIVNAGGGYDRTNCGRGLDLVQQTERRRGCEGLRR